MTLKGFRPGDYVWYERLCWKYEGLIDHMGRVLIQSLRDHTNGKWVQIENIKKCSESDIQGIKYFVQPFEMSS